MGTLKNKMFLEFVQKKIKNSIIFDKILYKPLFWSYGTWFWPSRSIENGFLIQMVPLWCLLELGNDVSWQNNVWHKFFLYKPCFGPYGTLFWPYHSIENEILMLLINLSYFITMEMMFRDQTKFMLCFFINKYNNSYKQI